jgi:hypothetical protein
MRHAINVLTNMTTAITPASKTVASGTAFLQQDGGADRPGKMPVLPPPDLLFLNNQFKK